MVATSCKKSDDNTTPTPTNFIAADGQAAHKYIVSKTDTVNLNEWRSTTTYKPFAYYDRASGEFNFNAYQGDSTNPATNFIGITVKPGTLATLAKTYTVNLSDANPSVMTPFLFFGNQNTLNALLGIGSTTAVYTIKGTITIKNYDVTAKTFDATYSFDQTINNTKTVVRSGSVVKIPIH
jgi:hypothetical protein